MPQRDNVIAFPEPAEPVTVDLVDGAAPKTPAAGQARYRVDDGVVDYGDRGFWTTRDRYSTGPRRFAATAGRTVTHVPFGMLLPLRAAVRWVRVEKLRARYETHLALDVAAGKNTEKTIALGDRVESAERTRPLIAFVALVAAAFFLFVAPHALPPPPNLSPVAWLAGIVGVVVLAGRAGWRDRNDEPIHQSIVVNFGADGHLNMTGLQAAFAAALPGGYAPESVQIMGPRACDAGEEAEIQLPGTLTPDQAIKALPKVANFAHLDPDRLRISRVRGTSRIHLLYADQPFDVIQASEAPTRHPLVDCGGVL